MIEHHRLRELLLCALALYVATSLTQMHTAQKAWAATSGISTHDVAVAVKRYVREVAETERSVGDMFGTGD